MAKFLVGFDGKWHEKFDSLDEAVEWAQEVSETGREVWVAERSWFGRGRLRAVFPEERRKMAEAVWDAQISILPGIPPS
ncbi:MAG: hypothetical protein WA701_16530 [Solirubrobacterales bacterium]